MQSVIETSIFTRRADDLLSWDERAKLIGLLASQPDTGDLVPGLGGIRKLRFAAGGRGKSGAFRVIYYVQTDAEPILALLIYGKGEQANPTPEQRKAMVALVDRMKEGARRKRA
jgi:mRNA-degrading endonuclease RelE of RelBE toxin-antitoxin system